MARYLLKKNAFIGSRWCRAGSLVDFDGVAGPHMEALDGDPVVVEAVEAKEPVDPVAGPAVDAVGPDVDAVVRKPTTKAAAKATS